MWQAAGFLCRSARRWVRLISQPPASWGYIKIRLENPEQIKLWWKNPETHQNTVGKSGHGSKYGRKNPETDQCPTQLIYISDIYYLLMINTEIQK